MFPSQAPAVWRIDAANTEADMDGVRLRGIIDRLDLTEDGDLIGIRLQDRPCALCRLRDSEDERRAPRDQLTVGGGNTTVTPRSVPTMVSTNSPGGWLKLVALAGNG